MASGDETLTFALVPENVQTYPSGILKPEIDCFLTSLPERARLKVWKFLSSTDLLSIGEVCSELKEEISGFISADFEETSEKDFRKQSFLLFILGFPEIQLFKYLDASSRQNMRLVCRDMKLSIDYYSKIDFSTDTVNNSSTTYDVMKGCMQEVENYLEHQPVSDEKSSLTPSELTPLSTTTIFDLYIQDLKRICSFLPNRDLLSLKNVCVVFMKIVEEVIQYPFKDYKETCYEINLMDLPSEIHEKILSFCPSHVRPVLRLVSKLMQVQVDTLVGVPVYLNDRKWNWINDTRVGTIPPASSLIVWNVENLQSISYFISDCNSRLLTRLVLDGSFLPKAFLLILKLCSNLRYVGLTFALEMGSIEDEFKKSRKKPIELHSLRALNLKMQDKDISDNNPLRVNGWTWLNAFEIMKPSILFIPNLTSFYICEYSVVTHNLLYEVADKVLKFMVEHRHTLKYAEVILTGTCFRSCICPAYHSEVPEEALKGLKLLKYSCDCDWRISRPFNFILDRQRSLQQLSFFKLSDWEFYAGIINQNRLTLKSVTIEKNLAPVIDLAGFASCLNLEYLWISKCGSSNVTRDHPTDHILFRLHFDPCLKNWDQLPIGLKSLHVLDLNVSPSEIISIPRRLKNLEVLELQFVGKWDGNSFGFEEDAILEILSLRKLQSLFLEDIRPLKSQKKENDAMMKTVSKINLIPNGFAPLNHQSMIVAILIAEAFPSIHFMPEWRDRVKSYFTDELVEVALPTAPFTFERMMYISDDEYFEALVDEEEDEEENIEFEDELFLQFNNSDNE